jgi:hypothetical protein
VFVCVCAAGAICVWNRSRSHTHSLPFCVRREKLWWLTNEQVHFIYFPRKNSLKLFIDLPLVVVFPNMSTPSGKNHKKYRKDKPWDSADIDHWKVDEWKEEDMKAPLLEESSFATLFPKYREKYLREIWPIATKALEVLRINNFELHSKP